MQRTMMVGLLLLLTACSSSSGSADDGPAKPAGPVSSAFATASSSAAAAGASTTVFGGADWHAVFAGPAPLTLPDSMGGGQGTGMADDYTRHMASPAGAANPWKYGAVGGGGINWSPSRKGVVVTNINLKRDPTVKTVELWIKSALVKDVKSLNGPEVLEVGPTKALALAGAGTCTMKEGGAADFYWHDFYSPGDFAHELTIVVIAKDAAEDEKQVALTVLRQPYYGPKAKPYYKKP